MEAVHVETHEARRMLTDEKRAQNVREIETLKKEITRLAGHLNAANHRFLMLIAEFDRREGWAGDGATQSCAHWLNWQCGIDMGAAREKVRTARALENLPKISDAMARGELSYSKVRALTRVACPATEDYFLMIALHGTADHVEKLVRGYKRAKDAEELSREAQQQKNRYFSYRYDENGSLVFHGCIPAEAGALFLKVLQAAMDELPRIEPKDVSAETRTVKSDVQVRRADALTKLAESYVANGSSALNGADRHLVHVHVSAETLRHKEAGCCEIEDGPSIAAETARRLACDASVVALFWPEPSAQSPAAGGEPVEPLNVGRKTRTISAPLRRFLNARDRGCRFPGCTNTRCDAHHIEHWANGGETKPSNLVSLCWFHHRMVHEGRVEILILDDGALRFVKPTRESFDSTAPSHVHPLPFWPEPSSPEPSSPCEYCGIHINEKTVATRWCGESMDYGLAVEVLLDHARRAKREEDEIWKPAGI